MSDEEKEIAKDLAELLRDILSELKEIREAVNEVNRRAIGL